MSHSPGQVRAPALIWQLKVAFLREMSQNLLLETSTVGGVETPEARIQVHSSVLPLPNLSGYFISFYVNSVIYKQEMTVIYPVKIKWDVICKCLPQSGH